MLHKDEFWSGCKHVSSNVTKLTSVQCIAGRSFRSSRERWWFIAASRCVPKNNVGVRSHSSLTFTHFSMRCYFSLWYSALFSVCKSCSVVFFDWSKSGSVFFFIDEKFKFILWLKNTFYLLFLLYLLFAVLIILVICSVMLYTRSK